MVTKLIRNVGLALGVMAVVAPSIATAQQWPTKPVTFVSPFPPGGSVDPLARLFAAKLTDALGQQFIVENRTGASGSIGTGYVAKAPADGYTFVFVFDTHATNPYLLPKMTFDTVKDLTPVMLVGTAPMAFATAPSKPYKNFADYIKAAKAKPDTLSYGSVGSGSLGHLTMTLLEKSGGFKVVHVPYKGGGPMSIDIMGGQIDGGIGSVAVLGNHIRNGKMRALAVTGDTRSPSLPDVPTMAEQGFPGFSAEAWWAIFAPAGTPKAIIDKLNAEIVKITKEPAVNKQLTETMGMNVKASSPEALGKFNADEMARWSKVIKENNIKPD
ncbi:tripartite tricarboxylate transporter substrate binding protein [Zwartia sp.]|uniref:tripartite tricarboxylate transporter substrate binding protein n=1 Tax=Zwartia sp. TaxID=2978004 RepID=UPI0027225AC1|nr:tripartite tricarboxylate transporter substrate binding protein [Zwartia sp.]MDO9023227.1 tripartite tricarboxylate transporter substrate binding protein [Zwartia sp.]